MNMTEQNPDFQALFEQSPANFVVVDSDLRVVAATNGYLSMTMRTREQLIGQNILEAFPDDPNDPEAKGTEKLRSGIEEARKSKQTAWLPGIVRYPVKRPDSDGGGFEERYFTAVNAPVFDSNGAVVYVIHGNEDVTASVQKD